MIHYFLFALLLILGSCKSAVKNVEANTMPEDSVTSIQETSLIVLV